jgi:dihydrofolate reductase
MRKLAAFIQLSLDGFYADASGDMNWAHKGPDDAEWNAFVSGNASGGGELVFGRVTYEMMASFWPTPQAMQMMPVVAERMNNLPKIVFSRTLTAATWHNTRLITGDLATAVNQLKAEPGQDMVILGSGSLIAQLVAARLLDKLQVVINPLALGHGRALFAGLPNRVDFNLTSSQVFSNGNVVLTYVPSN